MMDACSDPRIEEITVMKCVRSGGTQAVIDNAIGYWIDQDPGPMLTVFPGLSDAKTWSKDHFDTMVRDTTVLRAKVHSDKIKDRKNEILHKTFPGGMLYIIGSVAASGFRQKTIQRALLDDVDGYELSAGGEGDPITLARNRTITYQFHGRKIIKVSNPTTRGLSRIEREFNESDQRHYYVPCPFCGYLQFMVFSRESQFTHLSNSYLRFDKESGGNVHYECENCKKPIDERYKLQMIRQGKWIPQRPQISNHAGFHLSELISPFSSWASVVKDFLVDKRSRETLRVFINQRLGESFVEDKAYELNDDDLRKRVEPYKSRTVPWGVLVITAGVDVQGDRLECVLVGWGKNQQSWFIDRRIVVGSPERTQTWDELDAYLAEPLRHDSGLLFHPWTNHGIACVTVDSSASTELVYRYIKKRQKRRFYAIKGDDGFKKPFIIDTKYEKRIGARFAVIGVDAIKVRLFDRLNAERAKDDRGQPIGEYPPGYIHFNEDCSEDFFRQLTSEKRIIIRDRKSGFSKWKWVLKEGQRNEVLDCFVYNIAAVSLLQPNFDTLAAKLEEKVAALEAKLEDGSDTVDENKNSGEPFETSKPKHPQRPRRPSGGWVDRWRR